MMPTNDATIERSSIMNIQKVYLIDSNMYEDIVRERVMLYTFVKQLAYAAKRLNSQEAIKHLQEMAYIYGEQAENLFDCWDIPGRFLAFGNSADLTGIKRIELLDYDENDELEEDSEDTLDNFYRAMQNMTVDHRDSHNTEDDFLDGLEL